MGTSISYRSPRTPRWAAAQATYLHEHDLSRICDEVANAAHSQWAPALSSTATRAYAETLLEAFSTFARVASESPRAELAVQSFVSTARARALSGGADPAAAALAERALQRVLIQTARGDRTAADLTGAEAARSWSEHRGASGGELIARYAGELVNQFAAHVVARDLPALASPERFSTSAERREFTRSVAARLAAAAEAAVRSSPSPTTSWPAAVEQTLTAKREQNER